MQKTREISVKDFAERVERFCDFFLSREDVGRDGSDDMKVIEKLKNDAADLQFTYTPAADTIEGLADYMKGTPNEVSPRDGR